jgi:hypothetical protein
MIYYKNGVDSIMITSCENNFIKVCFAYLVCYLLYCYYILDINFVAYPEVLTASISDQIAMHEFLDTQFHFFTSILVIGGILTLLDYKLIHFIFEILLSVCSVIMIYTVLNHTGVIAF